MFNSLELRAPFWTKIYQTCYYPWSKNLKLIKIKQPKNPKNNLKKRGLDKNIYNRNKMGFGSPINK